MEGVKVLDNFVKDLFIIIDEEMSLEEACLRYHISQQDMIKDQIKDNYRKGDVILIKNINERAYIVVPDDNIQKIATKLECSVDDIMYKNKLKAPVVFVGQRLLY